MTQLPEILTRWFAARGWAPRRHQLEHARCRARPGEHALLVAPTGAGKTLAGFLPTPRRADRAADGGAAHALHLAAQGARGRRAAQPADARSRRWASPIRVETRTGDTPSDRKARQRARPPQMLLTTPESLEPAALLSRTAAAALRRPRRRWSSTRSMPSPPASAATCWRCRMARLQAHRARTCAASRLSATVADPDAYRAWLAPRGDMRQRRRWSRASPGAEPDLAILLPEGRVPWSGHSRPSMPIQAGDGRDRARTRRRSSSATRAASPS